jgi:hypothetical protein
MTLPAKRRTPARTVLLDRSLEEFPVFRLSDTPDEPALSYLTDEGGRWRVLAAPGDRLPGTFDQDVYVELMHRYQEAGEPADGALTFTLHAFLRSMGRQADGRTYEQLRGALTRLERTTLQSEGSYFDATVDRLTDASFTLLTSVAIERRRSRETSSSFSRARRARSLARRASSSPGWCGRTFPLATSSPSPSAAIWPWRRRSPGASIASSNWRAPETS